MQKTIDADEFKKIAYGVLEHFKSICEKNDIYYILSFGTVLGAVRHNGFIPWDDDIDVCVFRKDYVRLIEAFEKENNSRYRLISTEVDSDYSLPHMKIVNTDTLLIQSGRKNYFPLGVWIDVFALDNVPDNLNERKKYFRRLEKYQSIWSILEFLPNYKYDSIRSLAGSAYKKIISIIFHNDSRAMALKLEKLAKKYENEKTKEVGVLSFLGYSRTKSVFKRELLSNCIPHFFEKDEYPIPKEYDKYLQQLYGDYMTPPPAEERLPRHTYTVTYKD